MRMYMPYICTCTYCNKPKCTKCTYVCIAALEMDSAQEHIHQLRITWCKVVK